MNSGTRERSVNKRLLGQYFTPPEVARFVLEAARIALGRAPESLLDPACGEGVFLETALDLGLVEANCVYGIDIDPAHARAAGRLGLGRNVARADALCDPLPAGIERARLSAGQTGGFDLVVGNPPFGGGRGGGRLEGRFAERFADLARASGAGAVILPSGVFANASSQKLRDSLLARIEPVAVVELPPGTFRRAGASAVTCVLVFRKRPASPSAHCLVISHPDGEISRSVFLRAARGAIESGMPGECGEWAARRIPVRELRGRRWDPGFWCRDPAALLEGARVPLEALGDFIEHITYGAIVTGEAAKRDLGGRVRVVGLRQLGPTGLDLRGAKRVRAGSAHDPARCRLRPGDVVMARSGVGSLLKGRVAVFDGRGPATVGCFVDLVRLSGLEPGYAVVCLRSRFVRGQVARIANGVGTPNLSFGEIRGLLIPRLGRALESRLAREEEAARESHARALGEGRDPLEAASLLDAASRSLDTAVFPGSNGISVAAACR